MSLTVKTPPAQEPVTLQEAKLHLRVSTDESDPQISALVVAARERAERYLNRSLVTQTLVYRLDGFPRVIELPAGPVQSVESITYTGTEGESQTVDSADYRVDAEGARIVPAVDKSWPQTAELPASVEVEYVAGYGDPDDVPEAIKQGLLLTLDRLHDRGDMEVDKQLATATAHLLWPYRQMNVPT